MKKTLNFKSKESYQKWLAYGHLNTKTGLKVQDKPGRKSVFESTPGSQGVKIVGKVHKVKHTR